MSYIGKGVEVVTFNTATTLDVAGNITVGGTVDGRDVATDGTKLDTIAANAIANLSEDTTPQLGGDLDLNTSNVIGTGNINVTGSITGTSFVSTGDMSFTNNSKAIFGTSPSLEIYHDGSNSILDDVGAGNFKMQLAGADKLEITSTGVDVTGTVTADGLTVESSTGGVLTLKTTDTSGATGEDVGSIDFYNSDISTGSTGVQARILAEQDSNGDSTAIQFYTGFSTGSGSPTLRKRQNIASNGDISFYEDTGTTQGFFWDASTQRLGLGTTSPSKDLHIASTGPQIRLQDTNNASGNVGLTGTVSFYDSAEVLAGYIGYGSASQNDFYVYNAENSNTVLYTNGSPRMTINSSGNVGIGTNSPSATLTVGAPNASAVSFVSNPVASFGGGVAFDAGSGNDVQLINYRTSNMQFGNGGSVDMTIDNSGNVGIGRIPRTRLEVASGNAGGDAGLDAPVLRITNTTPSGDWDSGDLNGKIEFYSDDASGNAPYDTAFIQSEVDIDSGTLPSGALVFGTATYNAVGGAVERMRIDSSGKVGIGTTPTAKLDISAGTNLNLGIEQLTWNNFSNDGIGITFSRTSSDADTMALGVADTDKLILSSREGLFFATGGASTYSATLERMRIDSSGNVGIGTTNPSRRLHVEYTDSNNITGVYKTSTTVNCVIAFSDGGSTQGEFSTRLGSVGDSLAFYTYGANERMRIHSDGDVSIINGYLYFGAVSNTSQFVRGGGLSGTQIIVGSASGGFYHQVGGSYYTVTTSGGSTSDETLKENVTPITSAVDKIKQLNGVYFNFIEEPQDEANKGLQIGVIAQNIEQQFPEIVVTDDDGIKSVRYEKLVAPLIEAFKEQQSTIESLMDSVSALKARITALETA